MKRRPPIGVQTMTTADAIGARLMTLRQRLHLSTGIQPQGHKGLCVSNCGCRDWPSYTVALATYGLVRDDFISQWRRRGPRIGRYPFIEILARAARRWPDVNVETLGAALWRHRYGDER